MRTRLRTSRPRFVSLLVALAVLAVLAIHAAFAAPAWAIGVLVPRDTSVTPLAIKYHRVHVELEDGTAVTRIEQVFRNHTDRVLEATYLVPLPPNATITEFALWMNGERVTGKVLDRGEARAVYESIVRRMQDPGLIEWVDYTLFQARVYPIPARGEQKVELRFTEVLPYEDAVYRYVYPLRTSGQTLQTLEDFTVDVALRSKTPVRNVYSPTHKVQVSRKGEHEVRISFEEEGALLQKDFELLYTVSPKDIGLNLLTYRPDDTKPGYFLLMAAPKATYAEAEIIGKEVIFVVDTSGSMAQESRMDHARAALLYMVEHLNPQDRFNIVRFSTDVEAFRPGFVSAEKERAAALEFARGLEPAGGTAIHEALLRALAMPAEGRPIVVFVTDGRPTVGETETQTILRDVAAKNGSVRARLFTFGVGDSVNTRLLDQLARDHGGTAAYLKPGAEVERALVAFYNKMSHPVLSDVALEIRHVAPFAVLPGQVPDLFRGDQLVVLGRYRTPGDAFVRLTGKVGDDARTYDYEGTFPAKAEQHAFIAQLWAHRQVGFLLEQIRLEGERPELVEETRQLALQYGIVTPYTSYLVVERTPQPIAPVRPPRGGPLQPTGRGGGGFAVDDAPAPAAPAARFLGAAEKADRRRTLARTEVLQEESGATAVAGSRAIRDLKEEEQVRRDGDDSGTRYAGGKVFVWQGGAWVDREFSASLTVLTVKWGSAAYFKLLDLHPQMKAWLALGARVTVVLGKTALVIGPDGKETLTDAELKRLKP